MKGTHTSYLLWAWLGVLQKWCKVPVMANPVPAINKGVRPSGLAWRVIDTRCLCFGWQVRRMVGKIEQRYYVPNHILEEMFMCVYDSFDYHTCTVICMHAKADGKQCFTRLLCHWKVIFIQISAIIETFAKIS